MTFDDTAATLAMFDAGIDAAAHCRPFADAADIDVADSHERRVDREVARQRVVRDAKVQLAAEARDVPIVRGVSALELLDAPDVEPVVPEYPWVVPGTIAALVAAPAAGKTLFALAIAAAVAKTGQRVAFMALEGFGGLKKRVSALALVHRLDETDMARITFYGALDLSNPVSASGLAAAAGDVALVVIDTWACALGGFDENSANDTSLALRRLNTIGGPQAARIVLHHCNRASASERGSGALRAGVDVLAFLDDQGESCVLRIEKVRDGELPTERAFRLRPVIEACSVALVAAEMLPDATQETDLSPKTRDVLRELRRARNTTVAELLEAMKGRTARSTIYGALETLGKLGLAAQGAHGRWAACPISHPTAGKTDSAKSLAKNVDRTDSDDMSNCVQSGPINGPSGFAEQTHQIGQSPASIPEPSDDLRALFRSPKSGRQIRPDNSATKRVVAFDPRRACTDPRLDPHDTEP